MPFYAVTVLGKWRRAKVLLITKLGREPTEAEIAAELGLNARRLSIARQALKTVGLAVRSNSTGYTEWEEPEVSPFEGLADGLNVLPRITWLKWI